MNSYINFDFDRADLEKAQAEIVALKASNAALVKACLYASTELQNMTTTAFALGDDKRIRERLDNAIKASINA